MQGGGYFVGYIPATQRGVYEIQITWPTDVESATARIINDVTINIQDRTLGLAATLSTISYFSGLSEDMSFLSVSVQQVLGRKNWR